MWGLANWKRNWKLGTLKGLSVSYFSFSIYNFWILLILYSTHKHFAELRGWSKAAEVNWRFSADLGVASQLGDAEHCAPSPRTCSTQSIAVADQRRAGRADVTAHVLPLDLLGFHPFGWLCLWIWERILKHRYSFPFLLSSVVSWCSKHSRRSVKFSSIRSERDWGDCRHINQGEMMHTVPLL